MRRQKKKYTICSQSAFEHWEGGRPPRVYIEKILGLNTREERRAVLDTVPDSLREWVKEEVIQWMNFKKFSK